MIAFGFVPRSIEDPREAREAMGIRVGCSFRGGLRASIDDTLGTAPECILSFSEPRFYFSRREHGSLIDGGHLHQLRHDPIRLIGSGM